MHPFEKRLKSRFLKERWVGVHSFDKLGAKMGVHSFFWQRVRAVRHTKNMGAINGLQNIVKFVKTNTVAAWLNDFPWILRLFLGHFAKGLLVNIIDQWSKNLWHNVKCKQRLLGVLFLFMQKANLVFLTIFSVTFSCSNETVSCQKLEKVNSDQQKKGFKFLIFSRGMFNVLEEYNDDKTKGNSFLF